jgi:hypothetical protein
LGGEVERLKGKKREGERGGRRKRRREKIGIGGKRREVG